MYIALFNYYDSSGYHVDYAIGNYYCDSKEEVDRALHEEGFKLTMKEFREDLYENEDLSLDDKDELTFVAAETPLNPEEAVKKGLTTATIIALEKKKQTKAA